MILRTLRSGILGKPSADLNVDLLWETTSNSASRKVKRFISAAGPDCGMVDLMNFDSSCCHSRPRSETYLPSNVSITESPSRVLFYILALVPQPPSIVVQLLLCCREVRDMVQFVTRSASTHAHNLILQMVERTICD